MDQPGKEGIQVRAGSPSEGVLKWGPWLIVVFFIFQAFLSSRLQDWIHPTPFEASQVKGVDKNITSTLRAVALLTGNKVLVGHLFWIGVIQYYGDDDNAATRYAKLYDYCSLASDLNPQFISIYTFGANALAFHLKRIDQAARLLEKGIKANPQAERLKYLLAAISYQNANRDQRMIPVLEEEASRPDAPPMLVNILANTYQKVGQYQKAIRVWQRMLKEGDTDEQRIVAAQKLQELYAILKKQK
jgi:pentatricopeptide repeat protein